MNFSSFRQIIRRPVFYIVLIIIILGLAIGFLFRPRQAKETTVKAIVATVREEMSLTGRVEPADLVELSLERTGRATWIPIEAGQKVFAGEVLLATEAGGLSADKAKAEASLLREKALLAELVRGKRPEERALDAVKVANAEAALLDEKKNLISTLSSAFTSVDDAFGTAVDPLFDNPKSSSPFFKYSVDSARKVNLEAGQIDSQSQLLKWRGDIRDMTVTADLIRLGNISRQYISSLKEHADFIALVINGLSPSTSLSASSISTLRSDVSGVRTTLDTEFSAIVSAEEAVTVAESALRLAREQIKLNEAGSDPEKIKAQEAAVASAMASVSAASAELAKTMIRAPFAGVVGKINAKRGEVISANVPIISLIGASPFEIEAFVSEADVARVSVGRKAHVTLDALGLDVPFDAVVSSLEQAETVLEGVPTYKTVFQFSKIDPRIKSGMTANVDVIGDTRENVVALPGRAISLKNGTKTVKVREGETVKEVVVETGLRGGDGLVEIISGLREGDTVVLF